MVYLRDNAAVVGEVVAALPDGWPGVIVMVTNPVDPLCAWLQRRHGLDRRRLIGYTANDSLRLRTAIGDQLGVRSSEVDAWVLGEHGDRFVPLLDRVRVGGEPVALDEAQQDAAVRFVRHWYERHVALDSGRSSTWTTGRGLARMVAALASDDGELWPASIVLEGEYGVSGTALTVPVTLARGGVREVHEWDLTERAARRDGSGRRGRARGRGDPLNLPATRDTCPSRTGTPRAQACWQPAVRVPANQEEPCRAHPDAPPRPSPRSALTGLGVALVADPGRAQDPSRTHHRHLRQGRRRRQRRRAQGPRPGRRQPR